MNKYKLINKQTEERICEKVVIDGWDYYVSDKMPNVGSPFYDKELNCVAWRTDNSLVHKNDVEIIATNNPSIDIPKVVDEVERLKFIYNEGENKDVFTTGVLTGIEIGYNKSQETHPFSEEDMIEFSEWLDRNTYVFDGSPTLSKNGKSIGIAKDKLYCRVDYTLSDNNCGYTTKELLQLWKEQRTKTLYYEKIT